jgi:serine/threonine-protein kinase
VNAAELVGQNLGGKYEIVRLIGEGGMGAVFEARQTATGRRVAVKVIQTLDLAKNEQLLQRFEREARAAGGIESKHIAQVLDMGADPSTGFPFLVLELLDGQDCSQLLKRIGPVAPRLALAILAQACLGLSKAHASGVLHRDIKPANLFLARRDDEIVVKILDFGVAKMREDELSGDFGQGLTRTGSMIGSPLFMAPEQARGLRNLDQRADLWSLGIVAYQLLTGRTPHQDIQALGELILAICSDPVPPVQSYAPWVTADVAAIVHGALCIDPSERFPSAKAMLDAITPLLPNGWEIDEGELVPMTAEERALVAPRADARPATPAVSPRASSASIAAPITVRPDSVLEQTDALAATAVVPEAANTPRAPAPSEAPRATEPVAVAAPSSAHGATVGGVEASPPTQPPRRGGATWVVVAAALGGIAIGGGLKMFGSPPQAPVAAAPAARAVHVAISPADAAIVVDGASASAAGGVVTISGTLGSVHKVRLTAGGATREADVVISEAGAVPAKLELSPAK